MGELHGDQPDADDGGGEELMARRDRAIILSAAKDPGVLRVDAENDRKGAF
jgi:hypothetical protein